jgi:hypothetical protein
MRACLVPVAALVGLASVAGADGIQKWRTPGGSLYFGDRPPAGSTLVETYADTPSAPQTAPDAPSEDSALSKAAADGREIIRQREEARAEQRRADQEREAREAEAAAAVPVYDSSYPWYIATTNVAPCRVGDNCVRPPHGGHHHRDGKGRPPGGNSGVAVVSPPLRPPPPPAPPQSSGSTFGRSRRLR